MDRQSDQGRYGILQLLLRHLDHAFAQCKSYTKHLPDIDVCLAGSGSPWSCCPGPVQYAGRTLSWAQGRARLLPACWAQVSRRESCCLHCPAAQGRASRLLARPFALRYQPPAEQLGECCMLEALANRPGSADLEKGKAAALITNIGLGTLQHLKAAAC